MPFRGSSFNNTSNGGLGALNLNNARSNVNNNVSFRSASPHFASSRKHKCLRPVRLGLRGLFPFRGGPEDGTRRKKIELP